MKADTFARLVTLETLVDAEIGFYLEHRPDPAERFREALVSRLSDLVDEIDALDAVAAARVYDAIVDFLAELTDDDEGVVAATLHFKRAIDRIGDRAMDPAELMQPDTWAFVLDELLEALAEAYAVARPEGGALEPRAYLRARFLLNRARDASERMVWDARPERRTEVRNELDRLAFAVHNQRPDAAALDALVRSAQRLARRYRPSNLRRIGAFVVGQLLRRRPGTP
ncbi:MAG TPA: hypothetical protein VFX98_15680 [Longimicrobiaceae bacterium]|nr:hypothetical protein [Longimicrobiaceae bacterium]